MDNRFFERPILNSPYRCPIQHWELDDQGQPTQRVIESRRPAAFITPIPKPRKRKGKAEQQRLALDEATGLSNEKQQYATTSTINELRFQIEKWRSRPNPNDWEVTPETARLLQHWRHHPFSAIRPFFCQIEAVETAIWLTEVAPKAGKAGARFLEHLANANHEANPGKEGIMPQEIGIFVRSEAEFPRARAAAGQAQLPFKMLDENVETTGGFLSIGAMYLAKGLEFRAVAVMACDDEVIPLQERIETVTDNADLEEVYNTERHLLYVACTRARDRLLATAVAPASEFLDDLGAVTRAPGPRPP